MRTKCPECGRDWRKGTYVEVFWNLHKNCWSVRRKGRLWFHATTLILKDAKFAVQPAGNRKVRETGRKNVHAFVRGTIVGIDQIMPAFRRAVRYNPFKDTTFVLANGEPVFTADRVAMYADRSVRIDQ